MQHCDEDDLALMALGETVDPACDAHVVTCAECRHQLEQLREVVAVGRISGGPSQLVDPPPQVWMRVQEQLASEPVPLARQVQPAAKRGAPRWLGLVAASAAGVLIGGGAVAVMTGQDTPTSVVASAELTPMPDGPDRGGQAEATLNRTDGGYTVTVKASGVAGPEGFYEVWLLDEQDSGLIALGSLGPGEQQATFPVPDGVDLQTFNAVDVSDEPLDGDPTHSTVTVLRGTLQT
jgi:Anti-sigma-K factor rskA, C-terminal